MMNFPTESLFFSKIAPPVSATKDFSSEKKNKGFKNIRNQDKISIRDRIADLVHWMTQFESLFNSSRRKKKYLL